MELQEAKKSLEALQALTDVRLRTDPPVNSEQMVGMLAGISDAQSVYIQALSARIAELEEALKPFAGDWEAYLEARHEGESDAFADWQRKWRDMDDVDYAQAFDALGKVE